MNFLTAFGHPAYLSSAEKTIAKSLIPASVVSMAEYYEKLDIRILLLSAIACLFF